MYMRQKKIIFYVLIAIGLLIVVDLVIYLVLIAKNKATPNLNATTNQAAVTQIPVIEYVPPAGYEGVYYRERAFETKSYDPCLKIIDDISRTYCISRLMESLIKDTREVTFCEKVPDSAIKYDCVLTIARRNNNLKDCQTLENDPQIQQCRDAVTNK
jgi:hypothetical protein